MTKMHTIGFKAVQMWYISGWCIEAGRVALIDYAYVEGIS